jgi:hypothetical protein
MKKLIIFAASLSLGLIGFRGAAVAQNSGVPIVTTNASGTCVVSPSPDTPGANAGDWTVTCGDIGPGSGMMVVSPPPATTAPAPVDVAPAPSAPMETIPAETAVATETDLDADNYADALEPEAGLDPTNADTDVDGVADGDEINLYGTDPTLSDSDGDGVTDGEELFALNTNPAIWDDFSIDASSQTLTQESAPVPAPVVEQQVVTLGQETVENLSATNGDAAALGTGDASAAPGSITRDGVTVPSASILGPDGVYSVSEISPPSVRVAGNTSPPPVVEPAPAAAPVATETAAPVAADTAVATDTDLDADNYADSLEWEIGLDANNPDSDGDSVADGDEATIYGTDPFVWDSDGDGLSDGQELFAGSTEPLVGDTDGDGVWDGEEVPVA